MSPAASAQCVARKVRDGFDSLDDQCFADEKESEHTIGFFESGVAAPLIPTWADWFLELGLNFPDRATEPGRSIVLITTPCDTPAAGLVALGVVLRDLAREAATDEAGHVAAIRAWATQYLAHCRSCHYRCRPQAARCGFEIEASGIIHSPPRRGKKRATTLHVHSFNDDDLVLADTHGCRDFYSPTDSRYMELRPEGWPQIATPENRPRIAGHAFAQLKPTWTAIAVNLERSYSGACFVGRRTGKDATKEVLDRAGFVLGGLQYPLSAMLTIADWGDDSVSRLRYVNTRGGACHFDRAGPNPEIAIVDGAAELSVALRCPQLRETSLIAVISRDTAPDKLECGAQSLHEVGDRYADVAPGYFEPAPPGISLSWKVISR